MIGTLSHTVQQKVYLQYKNDHLYVVLKWKQYYEYSGWTFHLKNYEQGHMKLFKLLEVFHIIRSV